MKIVYTLAKKHYPVGTTNVQDLLELAMDLGCDYLHDIKKGANATYISERTIQEVLDHLARVISDGIVEAHASQYIGLQANETTDVVVMKQLITYVRYVKDR